MSENIAILFSGYMAGVVFGSVMSVTLYKVILNKDLISSPRQVKPVGAPGQVSQ